MLLKTLVENTTSNKDYQCKHGLSFYIEVKNNKILFDLGSNGLFLENASKMGVDISKIDTVIISHGHVDHGGALKRFLEVNTTAKIYVKKEAFEKHITKVMGIKIDVGLDSTLKNHPQIIFTDKVMKINENMILFSDVVEREYYSTSNKKLFVKRNERIEPDDFSHEQSLIILDNNKKILISGCSHTGIVNILKRGEEIIDGTFDYVIGGFHLYNPVSRKKESTDLVESITEILAKTKTYYYTCHCTGPKAFLKMKETLKDQLESLSVGNELEL